MAGFDVWIWALGFAFGWPCFTSFVGVLEADGCVLLCGDRFR